MKKYVQSLADDFLREARSSPQMFEDLASMERYMSEAYDGRAFVEILQNADDAKATSLIAFPHGSDLVIANNGRPFNRNDLTAICRSGASSKRRGFGIGYRGIGFKSATSISAEIIIYSSGVYFAFSKSRCARELNKSADMVPTVRIPFPIDDDDISEGLRQLIKKYEKTGYTTFFIFRDANREKLLDELKDISSGWLLFLNHVENITVDFAHLSKKIRIKRHPIKSNHCLFTDMEDGKSWLTVCSNNDAAIAFRYDRHIIPCSSNEALFHCYLPTMDPLGYPFKANADFSTDPSRKHIIDDDDTKRGIEKIARLIVGLFTDESFDGKPYLIDFIATRSGISEASSYLDHQVMSLLKTARWIPLQNGTQVAASELKLIPSWFDTDSRNKVFSIVSSLEKNEIEKKALSASNNLEDFLMRCGCQPFGASEFGAILGSIDAVAELHDGFLGKLWGYELRSIVYAPAPIASFFLKDKTGNIIIVSNAQESVDFSEDFRSGFKGVLNSEELIQVCRLPAFSGIKAENAVSKNKQASEKKPGIQKKMEYSKWKTPVQNCMVSEQLQGHSPKDVSKKTLGYDIESIDQDGTVRYFTVKPVEALGNSFVLSEKEYSFAEQHSSNYGVYVIEGMTPENNMLIEDISQIVFEKRVREWEWVSGQYEVVKRTSADGMSAIDSRFLKNFSIRYLNKIQIAFLEILCDGGDLAAFESEFSCKASSIMMQVNSICDFYIGDTLIEKDFAVKSRYLGALKYMLANY